MLKEQSNNKNKNKTHVKVNPFQHFSTLVFLSSNVSPANCGSSLTVILYRETSIVKAATATVSENLFYKEKKENINLYGAQCDLEQNFTFFRDNHAGLLNPLEE